MKTVLSIDTARPVTIQELNGFFAALSTRVPGCFVSQGPSSRGRVTAVILASRPVSLETAEEVLDSLPHLCEAIVGLEIQENRPRRPRAAA